jgi:transposase-like protein
MPRSTSNQGYVNHLSFQELSDVLGPKFEEVLRDSIAERFAAIGRLVAEALIAGEVESLCGPKHSRKAESGAVRWGSQRGFITIRGVKEPIERPRVRTKDGKHEIDLETYSRFSRTEPLSDTALALVGSGVSTRAFRKTIQGELRHRGISKSAVSRRVIASTHQALEQFLQRSLVGKKFVALLIDGVRMGKTMVVVAIGVDKSGQKHILGWQIGSTENAVCCRDLLRKLLAQGLDCDRDYLFVLDGSKALKAAVQEHFGMDVTIQRCQEHKIRDVEGYLPGKYKKRFRVLLQAAFNERTYKRASDRLQKIRSQLLSISEPAANSLTEGLEHTLTLHRLGINGGVRESLRTTNIIESAFSRLRDKTRNVSNWTDCDQIERWLAFGLLHVERGFRRLPGYRQLSRLERQIKIALQDAKG